MSWKATGLVKPVWHAWAAKHKIDKEARDRFADAVGTSGTVLSSLNSGGTPMTMEMAERIAEIGGTTVVLLGAPEAAARPEDRPVIDRLRSAEAEVDLLRGLLLEGFALLGLQVELGADRASSSVRRTRRAPRNG